MVNREMVVQELYPCTTFSLLPAACVHIDFNGQPSQFVLR
jgi:hypothetical protein